MPSKLFTIEGINPDTGETLYLNVGDEWVDSLQDAVLFHRWEADGAIARLDRRNRGIDREDQIFPTLKGIA